jgi:hypothetical protein
MKTARRSVADDVRDTSCLVISNLSVILVTLTIHGGPLVRG